MKDRNRKTSYLRSMCIGGIAGLLFVIFFFAFSGIFILLRVANEPEPFIINLYFKLLTIISFISKPVYIIGEKLIKISLLIGPILFVLYWVAIGAIIALILDRFYFFVFRKSKINSNASK